MTDDSSLIKSSEASVITRLSLRKTPSSCSSLTTPSTSSLSSSSSTSGHDTCTSSTIELPRLLQTKRRDSALEKLFTGKVCRKSCDEAQEQRKWVQHVRDVRVAAFKVGTILYQSVKSNRNQLNRFKTATDCAKHTNELFGFSDLVSGDQLINAIKSDRAGKSPPRMGSRGATPFEDLQDIADLVYTMSTIEQSNASKRLNRAEIVTMIGLMVNQKLNDDEKPPIANTWQFYD